MTVSDAARHDRPWPEEPPRPGDDSMVCSQCGNDLSIDEFPARADRPGMRWTQCSSCRRTKARDRYLDVEKTGALNRARLTFVICEGDERLGLGCVDCGETLELGDHVQGVAQLSHVECPSAH